MAKWIITIELDADDNATADKIAAFANDAIAEACDRDMEDPVAGFDGFWSNAKVQQDN